MNKTLHPSWQKSARVRMVTDTRSNYEKSRLNGLTDDLNPAQVLDLLGYVGKGNPGFWAIVKAWRKKNGFPVDRVD